MSLVDKILSRTKNSTMANHLHKTVAIQRGRSVTGSNFRRSAGCNLTIYVQRAHDRTITTPKKPSGLATQCYVPGPAHRYLFGLRSQTYFMLLSAFGCDWLLLYPGITRDPAGVPGGLVTSSKIRMAMRPTGTLSTRMNP